MVGLMQDGFQIMIGFIVEFPLSLAGLLQAGLMLVIGLVILKGSRQL